MIQWLQNHDSITHAILIGGDVIGTIVVGWGILWEGPEQPPERHKTAIKLVIGGIIAEAVFSICLFAFDESISLEQQRKILALETKLLTTERQAANRDISVSDIATMGSKLSRYAGEDVEVIADAGSFEKQFLAGSLLAALSKANWVWRGPILSGPLPGEVPMTFQGVGVLATADKKSQDAARALYDAMPDDIKGVRDPDPIPSPDRPRVRVIIGDKKAPLATWLRP